MKLSIIILNYKSQGFTRQCVKGILSQPPAFGFEIIVVDNDSKDGVEEMIRNDFPSVLFVQTGKNLGMAGGNNAGIRLASGEYLCIMNPDIAVTEGALENLVYFLEANPKVGIAVPKLLNPDGTVQTSCRTFQTPWIILLRRSPLGRLPFAKKHLKWFLMLDRDHSAVQPVDWALGACMIVRRSAMEKVGLMDERYFLYFEDMDWCRRFWEAGLPVMYVGGRAEMYHYHQRQSATSLGFKNLFSYPTRVHLMSGIKYFVKFFRKPLPRVFTPKL